MRKVFTAIAAVSAIGYAMDAQAIDYNGSDTLENVTNYLVANFDCGDINYLAQGSSAGENAMCNNLQESAPMSRPLNAAKVCPNSPTGTASCQGQTNPALAGNLRVGFDGLAVARHEASFDTCESLTDWQTSLTLIYAGSAIPDPENPGEFLPANGTMCNTAERQTLVNNWGNLFDEESCGTETCTQLRHALRRDDLSGTTGVFMDLVGIDGFCNGTAPGRLNQDNDPIRRTCTNAERYCPGGNLGLVLAISQPDGGAGEPADFELATHNNEDCSFGQFRWAQASGFGTPCPNGTSRLGGLLCLYPTDADGDCGCNNNRNNRPGGSSPFLDARIYNEQSRYPGTCAAVTQSINEFHRLAANCSEDSSTSQIGCIVGTHSCYIGWAGRGMFTENPDTIRPLLVAGESPLDDQAISDGDYPLARGLYFNTLGGFSTIVNAEEEKMSMCYHNEAQIGEAMASDGYIPAAPTFEPLDCAQFD